MSTIVTRAGKGSALTHNEVDANFVNLNTDKLQSGDTAAALTITSATINGGTITGVTTLTTTGNTILGDASTDTLNVGNGGLVKDASGNVGIGVSPTVKLDVNGSARLIGTSTSSVSLGFGPQDGVTGWSIGNGIIDNTHTFRVYDNTAGTTRMTIDSSGNLGLGVTPSAWGSSYKAIQLGSFGALETNNGNKYVAVASNHYNNGSGDLYIANGFASRYYTVDGTHVWNTAPSGTAGNAITFTQAMTLAANGQLSVSSTTANIAVFNSSTDGYILITQSGAAQTLLGAISTTGFVGTATNHDFVFRTNNTERMRIDSSGTLLLLQSTATNSAPGIRLVNNVSYPSVAVVTTGTTSRYGMEFYNTVNGLVGTININSTSTSYVTSSDYRLKENIAPMTGALDTVAKLKPVTYKWKADGADGQGFIAHELGEVVPDCVSGEKDATKEEEYEIIPAIPAVLDEEGNEITPAVEAVMGTRTVPVYQGIDTSFLVATLTAAIQEQQAMIDELKAKVAALEAA
jgi:hypothetical protein